MDCDRVQEAILDVLAGVRSDIAVESVRDHLDGCDRCRALTPETARIWVTVNQALLPEPTEEFWKKIGESVFGEARRVPFPRLQAKLSEYRDRLVRMAAADPSMERDPGAVVHRLEIEGEELDVVCHMKEKALVKLTIVDRRTRGISKRLDGGRVKLRSGRTHEIRDGGVEIALQDLLEEIAFTIVKPDGTEVRVSEP
jgi:hypothetical protein